MDAEAYYSPQRPEALDAAVVMDQAEFTWKADQEEGFKLKILNLNVRKGQFIGVIGRVGSGKSSLLQAITGDLVRRSGRISVTDSQQGLAIVTQEPWIQHGSIRDNILFGKPYDAGKYRTVLDVCALNADLRLMADGDQTQVGDNGVTLSGGQKARIALARAVYQVDYNYFFLIHKFMIISILNLKDKAIYLMDDILSAVDTQVARHLIDSLLIDHLERKTRILCTHHAHMLQSADWIIVLNEGRVVSQGPPSKILFQMTDDVVDHSPSLSRNKNKEATVNDEERESVVPVEEERSSGRVKFDVYSTYWKSVGIYCAPAILASLLMMQSSKNISDWWLAHWVSQLQNNSTTNTTSDPSYYLGVYGAIAAGNSCFTFARAFLFAYGGLRAAQQMHSSLVDVILKAKMIFFDATPMGRVLNRFSSDIYTIDDSLPFMLNIFLAQLFGLFGNSF